MRTIGETGIDKRHNYGYHIAIWHHREVIMRLKTRIFELSVTYYRNLSELAQAMGISVSQVYRIKEGKRRIHQKFIVGALTAFPEHRFDDLFYFAPETCTTTRSFAMSNRHMPVLKPVAKREYPKERFKATAF